MDKSSRSHEVEIPLYDNQLSGSYHQDDVDSFLLSLKTVKRIESILRDNTKCEFIPVCIPEAMAVLETNRLLTELTKSGIFSRQIIINNLMLEEDCEFCRRKKAGQAKYLQEITETYSQLNIAKVPMFPEEIKGLEALNHLQLFLFNDQHPNP